MLVYMRGRFVRAIPVLFGVSIIVFSLLHLVPGDPVLMMVGESAATAENIRQIREELGLNDPILVQYLRYAGNALRGDLGRSMFTKRPVTTVLLEQIPATIQLTVAGMAIAFAIGAFMGVLAAVRQNTWIDALSMTVALAGVSMPSFWLGLLLILLFGVRLNWVPIATGSGGALLILPAFTLGVQASAVIARLVRSSLLEVLRQDYIRTARSKGLSERVVIYKHALRNSLIPVVTMLGIQFGQLLAGTVVIETVFARQGLGRLTVTALLSKDYPVVQGTIMVAAVAYIATNLVVDLTYGWIDPRIRFG